MKKYITSAIRCLQRVYSFSCHGRNTCTESFPERITVSGFFNEGFGLGRAAELTALALEKKGFYVTRHDARAVLRTKPWEFHIIPGRPEDGWIIHVNPAELISLLSHVLPNRAPQGLRLGVWAWELSKAPKQWRRAAQLLDGVLSPSQFVTNSLSELPIPVWTLPHPVSLTVANDKPAKMIRKKKEPFTFFLQFDGRSSIDRKNPVAAIQAFKIAFANIFDVRLLIKAQHLTPTQHMLLTKMAAGSHNITLIDDFLKTPAYNRLFESIDCLVSSHKSEGFGLAIAEAMVQGIPVLATGWSGNVDFMSDCPELLIDYELVPVPKEADVYGTYADVDSKWAEIDIPALARSFKKIKNTPVDHALLQKMYNNVTKNEKAWTKIKPNAKLPWY